MGREGLGCMREVDFSRRLVDVGATGREAILRCPDEWLVNPKTREDGSGELFTRSTPAARRDRMEKAKGESLSEVLRL